ncbi:MAG: hypothetical protein R3E58_16220 [Phycisphaerae bacterium]
MVRLRSGLMRTAAAIAVGALLGMPSFANAGDVAKSEMVKGSTPASPQRTAERQVDYKDLKWTDATLVQQDGNVVVLEMRVPGEEAMAIHMKGQVVDGPGANQHPIQQFGLNNADRALGDNDILLYDASGFNAVASFTNQFSADDMISIPFGNKGQAFVIEEFTLVTLLIASNPQVDTWAEVRFYDLDEQVVNDCTFATDDVPIEGQLYGRVVANLGRDAASPACNLSIANSARRTVNLNTGVVTGFGDAPLRVIDSNGVKVNTVGAGAFEHGSRNSVWPW